MKRRWTTKSARYELYAAARFLGSETEQELGLQIPFDIYSEDPQLAADDPESGFEEVFVRWEPGIGDGPTSARFAVVDFNGDTGRLAPKAEWSPESECFLRPPSTDDPDPTDEQTDQEHRKLWRKNTDSLQFHQVNVWATLQRALEFFEASTGLGRRIPFGFDGNRLIVVPHAGYGKNAFYDRASKSLQFYYFDDGEDRIYTCLSSDIINHEFGHAVLDGVRPDFQKSTLVETAAFHEFIGDLSAILNLLRRNEFRKRSAEATDGNLSAAEGLASIATQFGEAVSGNPYLRTARSPLTMADIGPNDGPHRTSEVLTAAMFDILLALAENYRSRGHSARRAFWFAINRMGPMAIQPLDLLPPVDVTFRDYALAVLRSDALSNPVDPHGHRKRIRSAFVERGILTQEEADRLSEPSHQFDRLGLGVFHHVERISSSRSAAYEFLNDNRSELFIPPDHDIVVTDLYDAKKSSHRRRRLPDQTVLTYLWSESVELGGRRFGEYEDQRLSLLCGGTLVLDENGAVVAWARKPGTWSGGRGWEAERREGQARLDALLDGLADRIAAGQVGAALGSSRGLLGSRIPPLTVTNDDGELQFQLSPHLRLDDENQDHYEGGRQWEPSS